MKQAEKLLFIFKFFNGCVRKKVNPPKKHLRASLRTEIE